MAKRPVFISTGVQNKMVQIIDIEFNWHAGFSISQKQKSIIELHNSFRKNYNNKIIEISSKSSIELGVKLSAFNLESKGMSVESIFQGSKKFENGGPFTDLYTKSSRDSKTDERIRNSGNIVSFLYKNEEWELEPKTAFYDWVYINILEKNKELRDEIINGGFDAFTDIEFNPVKSINCQANALALYISLVKLGLKDEAISSKENFLKIAYNFKERRVTNSILKLF